MHSPLASALLTLTLLVTTALRVAADDPAATPSNQLQIVSYNIRYLNSQDGEDVWANRVDAVAQYLADQDVFGLQEVTDQQIQDLRQRLPHFDWYGVGRTDGQRDGEATPIFWRKDRFTADARDTFWLGPDPKAVGQPAWGARLPRICSWVLLTPVDNHPAPHPAPLVVFNTHFDHQSSEAREQSAQLILREITRVAEVRAAVLMGDLNCRPDSKPVATLTATDNDDVLQLVDALDASQTPAEGPTGTWNGFKKIDPQGRIDYLFVRPGLGEVLQHVTDDPKTAAGRFASDHLPVRIRIAL